jgi:lipoate-protein ligase B
MSKVEPLPTCHVRRLGLVPYAEAWELQKSLAAQRAADEIPDTLLLLEHPHTYTFGRRGNAQNLLLDEAGLRARGIELHWVDRGGDVTYHGPGQLVGYPILKLGAPLSQDGRLPQADYVGYVRRLEAVLIRVCARFGLVTGQVSGLTGVWVQPDVASRCPHCPPSARLAPSKIAAIGVKVDARGVSQHGFALNVAPDMSYWEGIIGCGLHDHAAISLADLLEKPPTMAHVMDEVAAQFGRVFDQRMERMGTDEADEDG